MDRDEFLAMPKVEQDKVLNSILADHATSVEHMAEEGGEALKKVLGLIHSEANRIADKHGDKAALAFTATAFAGLEIKAVALRARYFPEIKKQLMEQIANGAREELARMGPSA